MFGSLLLVFSNQNFICAVGIRCVLHILPNVFFICLPSWHWVRNVHCQHLQQFINFYNLCNFFSLEIFSLRKQIPWRYFTWRFIKTLSKRHSADFNPNVVCIRHVLNFPLRTALFCSTNWKLNWNSIIYENQHSLILLIS